MKRLLAASAIAALLGFAATATSLEGYSPADEPAAAGSDDGAPAADPQVERGRYLVENVGMCGQCHSPRNAAGDLLKSQWLHGAPVPVTAPRGYRERWAYKAPRIAGLPQHTDEEFVTLLTTGINRDGRKTLAPMPSYRMKEGDALAIAAYLRSLP
ncbi:MAG: hypothetical protein AAGN66_17980 [Acidobacteriota bacterium]